MRSSRSDADAPSPSPEPDRPGRPSRRRRIAPVSPARSGSPSSDVCSTVPDSASTSLDAANSTSSVGVRSGRSTAAFACRGTSTTAAPIAIGAAMAGIQRVNLRDAPVSRGRMLTGYARPRHPEPIRGQHSGSSGSPRSTADLGATRCRRDEDGSTVRGIRQIVTSSGVIMVNVVRRRPALRGATVTLAAVVAAGLVATAAPASADPVSTAVTASPRGGPPPPAPSTSTGYGRRGLVGRRRGQRRSASRCSATAATPWMPRSPPRRRSA